MLSSLIKKLFCLLILAQTSFGALPTSFGVGWHLIAGPNVSMTDFLSTYTNVEKIYTYQSSVWSIKERTPSVALSTVTTFSEFNVDYGYWVYVNPISNLAKTGSSNNISLQFDIASIINIPSVTMSLDYSLNSGTSWISSRHIQGTTYPSSPSTKNILTWTSSLDIQQSETNVTIRLNSTYGTASAYVLTGPFSLSNQAITPTTETTPVSPLTYKVAHTNQTINYSDLEQIQTPNSGESYFGQDPVYMNNPVSYTNNNDGTVTDNVTGLMWQQTQGTFLSFDDAKAGASTFNAGGHSDWRLPTIKELFSLILFSGKEGESTANGNTTTSLNAIPFIHEVFEFQYISQTSRYMDIQNWTDTEYVSTTMNGDATVFGVNFADGRIKGYPKFTKPGNTPNTMLVRYVRGNTAYGTNVFVDNGDLTVSDTATGLTWAKNDSGTALNWQASLNYCESLTLANKSDWRLPHIKEIQSLVDYSKSPDTSGGAAAINPIFNMSTIAASDASMTVPNYPYYWSSTTHLNHIGSTRASYITFGEALGWMQNPQNNNAWVMYDVHGAGSQKSDPKSGSITEQKYVLGTDSSNNTLYGLGPQGDLIFIDNYVRCVR